VNPPSPISSVSSPSVGVPVDGCLRLPAKTPLYQAGARGTVWRVLEGVMRLDQEGPAGPRLAGLLLPDDLVGCEVATMGRYGCTAWALVPSLLMPWTPGAGPAATEVMLQGLLRVQQRTGELLALRSGLAEQRVSRLILMLAGPEATELVLPTLNDMADINDLAMESVSRAMSRLRQLEALTPLPRRHRFALNRAALLRFA